MLPMRRITTEVLLTAFLALTVMAIVLPLQAQEVPSAPVPKVAPAPATTTGQVSASVLRITLKDALQLARKNSTQFQSAATDAGVTREDKVQARTELLPGVDFNTSALYTQPNALGNVKFIANNAAHEYISQGNVHELLDMASVAAYRRTAALAAAAKARAEIATRGLVVTVVESYFAVGAAEQVMETSRRTAQEGEAFLKLTQELEHGGEVAHSDVIKAELQAQDRRRQLQEAQLTLLNARLDLAVLIFPDFNDNFETADDLHLNVPLPVREEFEAQAAHENPEIREALANAQAAGHDVTAPRGISTIHQPGLLVWDRCAELCDEFARGRPEALQPGFLGDGSVNFASLELGRDAEPCAPSGVEARTGQERVVIRATKIAGGDALAVFGSRDSPE